MPALVAHLTTNQVENKFEKILDLPSSLSVFVIASPRDASRRFLGVGLRRRLSPQLDESQTQLM